MRYFPGEKLYIKAFSSFFLYFITTIKSQQVLGSVGRKLFICHRTGLTPCGLTTEISDAMTKEGAARERIAAHCLRNGEEEEEEDGVEKWKAAMERESLAKSRANEKLMECNLKYQNLMKELRESQ